MIFDEQDERCLPHEEFRAAVSVHDKSPGTEPFGQRILNKISKNQNFSKKMLAMSKILLYSIGCSLLWCTSLFVRFLRTFSTRQKNNER